MSQGIEPMTAAEYHAGAKIGKRIIAALEEREALLGERAVLTDERDRARTEAAEVRRLCDANLAHARVGALVAAIREHKMFKGAAIWMPNDGSWHVPHLSDSQLEGCLSHLDSLLPKEPEWSEFAPSNRQYRLDGDALFMRWGDKPGERVWREYAVPLSDVPVVAALMAKGGKDD